MQRLPLERLENHHLQGAARKKVSLCFFLPHPPTPVDIDYIALGMGQPSLLPGVCQPFCLTRSAPSANSLAPGDNETLSETFRLSGVVRVLSWHSSALGIMMVICA
jgi:hypothetical protein